MKKPNYHIELRSVGQLEITDYVLLADPCYCADIVGGSQTEGFLQLLLKPGLWDISVKILRQRSMRKVISLTLEHKTYKAATAEGRGYKTSLGFVSVDSGQLSVVDKQSIFRYYSDKVALEDFDDEYYDECCDITVAVPAQLTEMISGVVTNTGYGDGNYEVTGVKDGDELLRLNVSFIENYD